MSDLWMVWDSEDGLVYVGDYDYALIEYDTCVSNHRSFCANDGFNEDERTILAKVSKQLYAYDTKEPHEDADDKGSEYYGTTYWDFKEVEYDDVY